MNDFIQDTLEMNYNIYNIQYKLLEKIDNKITYIWNSTIHIRNVIKKHIFDRDIFDVVYKNNNDIYISIKDDIFFEGTHPDRICDSPLLYITNIKEIDESYCVKHKLIYDETPINKILNYIRGILLGLCTREYFCSKSFFVTNELKNQDEKHN